MSVLLGELVGRYEALLALARGQREALAEDDVEEFGRLARQRQELLALPVEMGQWREHREEILAVLERVQEVDGENMAALALRMALAKKQLDSIRTGRQALRGYKPGIKVFSAYFDEGA